MERGLMYHRKLPSQLLREIGRVAVHFVGMALHDHRSALRRVRPSAYQGLTWSTRASHACCSHRRAKAFDDLASSAPVAEFHHHEVNHLVLVAQQAIAVQPS